MIRKILFAFFLIACSIFSVYAQKKPMVALVLSGGSAYGLAHIGVIKVLEELHIPIDLIVGTSMGSVVGGFYASGMSAAELEAVSLESNWPDLFNESTLTDADLSYQRIERARYAASVEFDTKGFSLSGGIIKGRKILRYLDSRLLHVPSPINFDQLPIRFRSVATDVASGERMVIKEGSIADAMRASMSIPGIFSPWQIDDRYLVDGGVVENLPISVAKELGADIIIAVDLYDGTEFNPDDYSRTPIAALSRSFDLLLRATEKQQYPNATVIISVNLQNFTRMDFHRAVEFIEKGEKTAREHTEELLALAQSLNIGAPTNETDRKEKTEHLQQQLLFSQLQIVGATEKERNYVRSVFYPLLTEIVTPKDFDNAFAQVDRLGSIEFIRVYTEHGMAPNGGNVLHLNLVKKQNEKHAIRLNFLYETTFSTALTNSIDLIPALVYRGLTTDDSRLLVDAKILDTPGIVISFVQPFGSFFSISPFYKFVRSSVTRQTGSTISYQFQTSLSATGLAATFEPKAGVCWGTQFEYNSVTTENLSDTMSKEARERYLLGSAHFSVHDLDSPIFPMSGIWGIINIQRSFGFYNDKQLFTVLSSKGSAFLSLGTPFAVSYSWKGGTDFSNILYGAEQAPLFYQTDLAERKLFPGPLRAEERIGHHTLGMGLEIKHNVNWKDKGISLPVFVLLQGAVGSIWDKPVKNIWVPQALHWNICAGGGVRLSDAFGISVRGGIHKSSRNTFLPFISLDIGSFGY